MADERRFQPRSETGRRLVRHRDEVIALAAAHHAGNVRVFGSVRRGDDAESSDIDLLVALAPYGDLYDLVSLSLYLEQLLDCPVDVMAEGMLRTDVARTVHDQAVPL